MIRRREPDQDRTDDLARQFSEAMTRTRTPDAAIEFLRPFFTSGR